MSEPLPRAFFDTEEEYMRAYWEMSEFGVHPDDYKYFENFFWLEDCPQTEEEIAHFNALPDKVLVYRGFCAASGREDGLSWTPLRYLAKWFARRMDFEPTTQPAVAIAVVSKNDISSVLLSREVEYVLHEPAQIPKRIFSLPNRFKY